MKNQIVTLNKENITLKNADFIKDKVIRDNDDENVKKLEVENLKLIKELKY